MPANRSTIRSLMVRSLNVVSRTARGMRLKLLARGVAANTARTNDDAEWDALYDVEPQPVRQLQSAVARTLADLTAPGDVLMETGCGSGSISAELATAGRQIRLLDFSQNILDRAAKLFEVSGLPKPELVPADMTRPLDMPDGSVDYVWNSGTLEHWTDDELKLILGEQARVCRRGVISCVPNAACVFYRFGKERAEQHGVWPYGRELPRVSQRDLFERAGLHSIREFTIWPEPAPDLIGLTDPDMAAVIGKWWRSLPADDPVKAQQGYLLVTVGYKGEAPQPSRGVTP